MARTLRPARDLADALAAPLAAVGMISVVLTVLRPAMADAPMSYVTLSLTGCALQFVALLAIFFERERRGWQVRLLLAGAGTLAAAALLFGTNVELRVKLFGSWLPVATALAASVLLQTRRAPSSP